MCFLCSCTPLTQSSQNSATNPKAMRFIDFAYEPQIRTVVIRPGFEDPSTYVEPAVTSMGEWNLILEFDDLRDQREDYYARIIHCNYDWTRSNLMDLDFLTDFNEFPVNNFEFSVDTHIPYVHYWINLPPVILPDVDVNVFHRVDDLQVIIVERKINLLIQRGDAARAN